MKKVTGVKKYAKKFLSNVEMAEIPQAIEQMEAIAGLMEKDKSFRTFLVSPLFAGDEKQKALAFISDKIKISEKVGKFLAYISEEKVMGGLPEIVEVIKALYLEMKKRARAIVTSPVSFSSDFEAQLKQSLKQVTGRDIDMEFILDPALLGGVRIRIGSTMYDSSIKGQLRLLRDKFIEG
ncbi:MAG TPA: ATP synthase F1 subunit delta [Dissulfurispiraceae bacterium]|nr:ATP synthase F1 subunit delta [Dissulfurispiraceae bacterium]